MLFHDDVDKVVDGDVFVADEHFAVEDLVVPQDVVDHFLVEVFGGCLEGDFHAAGGFDFEVDVAGLVLVECSVVLVCVVWESLSMCVRVDSRCPLGLTKVVVI